MELLNIKIDTSSLSQNDLNIAYFLKKHLKDIPMMTINDIARECDTSNASISRFIKNQLKMGFKELKRMTIENIKDTNPKEKAANIILTTSPNTLVETITEKALNNITRNRTLFDPKRIETASHIIAQASRLHIYSTGTGASLSSLLSFRLNRLGISVFKIHSGGNEIYESLINIHKEDVVLVFCFSRVIKENLVLLQYCQTHHINNILITDLYNQELLKLSQHTIHVERGELWEFHSMVAPLVLVEIIVATVSAYDKKESLMKLDTLHKIRRKYQDF